MNSAALLQDRRLPPADERDGRAAKCRRWETLRNLREDEDAIERQLSAYASAFNKAWLGLYFPLLRGWPEWA